jgi:acyl carrier protein
MTQKELFDSIRSILKETFIDKQVDIDIEHIDIDLDLFDYLQINSMLAIEIIVRLENAWDVEFDDEELTPENIRTIRNISNWYITKTGNQIEGE